MADTAKRFFIKERIYVREIRGKRPVKTISISNTREKYINDILDRLTREMDHETQYIDTSEIEGKIEYPVQPDIVKFFRNAEACSA